MTSKNKYIIYKYYDVTFALITPLWLVCPMAMYAMIMPANLIISSIINIKYKIPTKVNSCEDIDKYNIGDLIYNLMMLIIASCWIIYFTYKGYFMND